MRSYPSTANQAGVMTGDPTWGTPKNIYTSIDSTAQQQFSLSRLSTLNLYLSTPVKKVLMDPVNVNISSYKQYIPFVHMNYDGGDMKMAAKFKHENVYKISPDIISTFNHYNFKYKEPIWAEFGSVEKTIARAGEDASKYAPYLNKLQASEGGNASQESSSNTNGGQPAVNVNKTTIDGKLASDIVQKEGTQYMPMHVTPSLFNTNYAVNYIGSATNVPLTIDAYEDIGDAEMEKAGLTQSMPLYDSNGKLIAYTTIGKDVNNIQYETYLQTTNSSGTAKDGEMAEINSNTIERAYITLNDGRKGYLKDAKGKFIKKGDVKHSGAVRRNDAALRNTTDCSIRTLCGLSKHTNSALGNARYKFSDFMFCKDLGKVSNNHLITLRRFAHPVGDNIGRLSTVKHGNTGETSFRNAGDVGRLVAWFDTDDNKLESILSFSYKSTWRELKSEIQEQQSREDDVSEGNRGVLGKIINTFNPGYQGGIGSGLWGGGGTLWPNLLGSWAGAQPDQESARVRQSNYDKNKIYEPKDTIQSTHKYEGKIEFTHEFQLVFSYHLRAYDNINPRSAMLDLIANILEVTARRGKFWGGARKLIGPPQSKSGWNKANHIIDNAYNKVGGIIGGLMHGDTSPLENVMAGVTDMLQSAWNAVKDMFTGGGGGKILGATKKLFDQAGGAKVLKGLIKNHLGRPALYAFDSLLSGENVGLWHVTIGNPLQPIAAFGNLILDNAQITHSGPLGIDGFPTEIKVTCNLKHARPRDLTEISRMYGAGKSGIYYHFGQNNLSDFVKMDASEDQALTKFDELKLQMEVDDARQAAAQKKAEEAAKTAESKITEKKRKEAEAAQKKAEAAQAAAQKKAEAAKKAEEAKQARSSNSSNSLNSDNIAKEINNNTLTRHYSISKEVYDKLDNTHKNMYEKRGDNYILKSTNTNYAIGSQSDRSGQGQWWKRKSSNFSIPQRSNQGDNNGTLKVNKKANEPTTKDGNTNNAESQTGTQGQNQNASGTTQTQKYVVPDSKYANTLSQFWNERDDQFDNNNGIINGAGIEPGSQIMSPTYTAKRLSDSLGEDRDDWATQGNNGDNAFNNPWTSNAMHYRIRMTNQTDMMTSRVTIDEVS